MPWTNITRVEYRRSPARYPSDLTDEEWALIGPLLPPAKPDGRPRSTNLRDVMDGILYITSSGCQWRMPPKCFPPLSTVQHYFYDWRDSGLWLSIKTTEGGGVCGDDAGKKIAGRKRHIITDTLGCMLFIIVHSAAIQDRDELPRIADQRGVHRSPKRYPRPQLARSPLARDRR